MSSAGDNQFFVFKEYTYDLNKTLISRGLQNSGPVQQYIDSEVLRLSESFIPKDTGELIRSGITNTIIGSGEVKWRTPYARRWYYLAAQFQEAPNRGNYWFERMKQQYRQSILDGAARIAGSN